MEAQRRDCPEEASASLQHQGQATAYGCFILICSASETAFFSTAITCLLHPDNMTFGDTALPLTLHNAFSPVLSPATTVVQISDNLGDGEQEQESYTKSYVLKAQLPEANGKSEL